MGFIFLNRMGEEEINENKFLLHFFLLNNHLFSYVSLSYK